MNAWGSTPKWGRPVALAEACSDQCGNKRRVKMPVIVTESSLNWETIMCGIIGFLDKRGGGEWPVGRTLLTMLQALSCRGPDSAGVAVFGPAGDGHLHLSAPAGVEADAV